MSQVPHNLSIATKKAYEQDEQAVRSIPDGQPGKSAQTIANKPTETVREYRPW
jgi:hypothetical protein